jgi:hypothetical protein
MYSEVINSKKPKFRFLDRLKQAWDENPVSVIIAGGVALKGAAALVNAVSSYNSRNAYKKQVDHRIKRDRKQ